MKKFFISVLVFMLCCSSIFILSACGQNDENGGGEGNLDNGRLYITDYTFPQNFAITIELVDTAINNPGNPWYFKTAKIGDDWQIIEYDRNLSDEQATHFFKYLSQDNYDHYTYNHQTSSWVKDNAVTFDGMIQTSLNNFLFLKKWERLSTITVTETNIQYDVDPTSNSTLINAIMYEFTNVLDYTEKVDAEYTDISLYHCSMDGSRVCYEFFAYEYSKSINDWSNAYLNFKSYKTAPIV